MSELIWELQLYCCNQGSSILSMHNVHNKMKKMLALMPKPDTDSHDKTAESLPKVTKIVMQIVHVIRNADKATHSKVWDKCSKDKRMM